MSMHIQKFVDRLRAAELRGQRDFIMSINDAKDLHADITRLLLNLEQVSNQRNEKDQVIEVQVNGGSF